MLKELTVSKFVEELASNSPAPGGGSVAALSASLAAALSSMVFNLTIGKKVYNESSEEVKSAIDSSVVEANLLKEKFLNIMEEDTKVFLKVMEAFKLPKETEEDKAIRKAKIAEAYKLALEVPYELAKISFKLYEHIDVAVKFGNINAVSDAGVAALLLQTAIESAVLNVKINLSSIEEVETKNEIKEECSRLISEGRSKRDEILAIAENKIG